MFKQKHCDVNCPLAAHCNVPSAFGGDIVFGGGIGEPSKGYLVSKCYGMHAACLICL